MHATLPGALHGSPPGSSAVPLCPEIDLSLTDDLEGLWAELQARGEASAVPPPYWSIAWVGGQALARYVLDHPALLRDRTVLDFGAGCGIAAIAAAKAGAAWVEASEIDPAARAAIAHNARLNGVAVTTVAADLIGSPPRWDVVLAGDLWYERFLADRLSAWLAALAGEGTRVLLGDCGRAYFPRGRATELARYRIASPAGVERDAVTDTAVWRLR